MHDEVLRGPRLVAYSGGNSEESIRKKTVEREEPAMGITQKEDDRDLRPEVWNVQTRDYIPPRDSVVKTLTVQKKLIEQLGVVCGRLLCSFLLIYYGEQWPESLSQEDLVKIFSSKPAPAVAKKLGDHLQQKLRDYITLNWEWQHGSKTVTCCESIGRCYTELNTIILDMDPNRDYFISNSMSAGHSEYIVRGGLEKCRTNIERCLDARVRALVILTKLRMCWI